jgi:hypothetical protein
LSPSQPTCSIVTRVDVSKRAAIIIYRNPSK